MPLRAQASAVTWAANGVDLREPLKPAEPADSQAMTVPSVSGRGAVGLLKGDFVAAGPERGGRGVGAGRCWGPTSIGLWRSGNVCPGGSPRPRGRRPPREV